MGQARGSEKREDPPGWMSGKAASGSLASREQHPPDTWALKDCLSTLGHKKPGQVPKQTHPLGMYSSVCSQ